MSEAIQFALLLTALLIFILSTRQWSGWMRLAIWIVGAAFLVTATLFALQPDSQSLLLRALFQEWRTAGPDPGSPILRALTGNWSLVGPTLIDLFEVFLVFAAVLAIVSLAALTPGETIERLVRPALWMVIGATGGAALALAVVAIGFGHAPKRVVYVGYVAANAVYDGDTFVFGDVSLRIAGIDAPEQSQTCLPPHGAAVSCGRLAQEHLQSLIDGRVVVCQKRAGAAEDPAEAPGQAPAESFGRPLVACTAYSRDGEGFDLGARMIADGYAIAYRDAEEPYAAASAAALEAHRGIWTGCTISPDNWRNEPALRAAVERNRLIEVGEENLIGQCPVFQVG